MTVHFASVLAVARSSKNEAKARLQNVGVQYLLESSVVRAVQFLVVGTVPALLYPELLQTRILRFLSLARSSRDR